MTAPFRATMYSIMLGTCPCLTVLTLFRTLQTTNHSRTKDTRQIWILSIRLLTPTPTWITEDVHIRSPKRKTVETSNILSAFHQFIPMGTSFCARCIEYLVNHISIERCCHTDRLWEIGHIAHVSYSMQRFTPPLEPFDTQTRNGRRVIQHQLRLLFQGQATTQIHRSHMC